MKIAIQDKATSVAPGQLKGKETILTKARQNAIVSAVGREE